MMMRMKTKRKNVKVMNNYSLKMKTKNVPGQNSYCQKTLKGLNTCFCFHCVKEMNWRANNFVEEKIAFEG
jgi:hypothetical protein